MPPPEFTYSYTESNGYSLSHNASTTTTELHNTVSQTVTDTTPIIMGVITTTIAVLPLVFLISVILAFYISLQRHRPQNTYGLAPMIVVTRAKQKNTGSSSRRTKDTYLSSDCSRYSDGLSVSAAPSDWSIYTAESGQSKQPTEQPTANV